MNAIRQYDVVALIEEIETVHFETRAPLTLHRGQMGTALDIYPDGTCEVEFSDVRGHAYAMLPVRPEKLMVLHSAPLSAAA